MSQRYDSAVARVQHTHVRGGSPQANGYKVIFKGTNRSKRHAYTLSQIFGVIPPNPAYDLERVTQGNGVICEQLWIYNVSHCHYGTL